MTNPLEFLLQVIVAGGGAAAIAYWLFTTLGTKWLENRFSQRLEALKHAQNQELERYKYQIQVLFNRISKIQDREFEVLPAAWNRLQDALGPLFDLNAILQTFPDLDRMAPGEVEHFISNSELIDTHKEELRAAHQKTELYQKRIFWYRVTNARKAHGEFHNYLIYNRIFLTRELFDKFEQIDDLITQALIELEVTGRTRREPKGWREVKEQADKLQAIVSEIETLVQKRLHYQEVI